MVSLVIGSFKARPRFPKLGFCRVLKIGTIISRITWENYQTLQELNIRVQEYQIASVTKFSVWTCDKNFGKIGGLIYL